MTPIEDPIDRDAFLSAMSNVANSVTVVTTMGKAGHHGATVSSFCSVSADPPSVLVCLNAEGMASDMVMANQTFTVTVLPQDQQHVALRFAGAHDDAVDNRFDGIDIHPSGAPDVPGATRFHCVLSQIVRADSHWVFIGQVHRLVAGEAKPLVYLNRKFVSVDTEGD